MPAIRIEEDGDRVRIVDGRAPCSPSTCTGRPTCSSSRPGRTSARSARSAASSSRSSGRTTTCGTRASPGRCRSSATRTSGAAPPSCRGRATCSCRTTAPSAHRSFDAAIGCRGAGARPHRRVARLGHRGRRDPLRGTAHPRGTDPRRRRVAPRLRDADGERVGPRHPHRLAHDPRPRERRLRRAVLARPPLVHRRRPCSRPASRAATSCAASERPGWDSADGTTAAAAPRPS